MRTCAARLRTACFAPPGPPLAAPPSQSDAPAARGAAPCARAGAGGAFRPAPPLPGPLRGDSPGAGPVAGSAAPGPSPRSAAAGAEPSLARPKPSKAGADAGCRAAAVSDEPGERRFTVRLANFEGPFDLLLQLISKHKLDVTEVALSKVTDEFMAHIRAMGPDWDLDQTTEFLVVAATLLDLKAARLLPAAEVEDEADLALLEARDLLFARLLQYRAYKRIADIFSERLDAEARRYPRTVGLEPHLAELLPEVVISIGAEGFAKLAVKAMQPKAQAAGVRRPHPRPARVACGSRPRSWWPGCGRRARPASRCSPRTPRTPSPSSPASWPCWSCTARRPSSSTRTRRWGS